MTMSNAIPVPMMPSSNPGGTQVSGDPGNGFMDPAHPEGSVEAFRAFLDERMQQRGARDPVMGEIPDDLRELLSLHPRITDQGGALSDAVEADPEVDSGADPEADPEAVLVAGFLPLPFITGKALPDPAGGIGLGAKRRIRQEAPLDGGRGLQRALELTDKGVTTPVALRAEASLQDGEPFLRGRELAALMPAAHPLMRQAGPNPNEISMPPAVDLSRTVPPMGDQAPARTRSVLDLPPQVGRPGWDQALGSRILWMASRNTTTAELRLNPAHLGPVDVRISVEGDRTHVSFAAQHSVTREAIDAAIPRLREMFAENGVSLGQVNVSSQGSGGPGGGPLTGEATGQEAGGAPGEDEAPAEGQTEADSSGGEGLVDYYA